MSHYEDDYSRRRSSHHPDYTHSGNTTEPPPDYNESEALVLYEEPPRAASPGYTTYNGNPPPPGRWNYEPQGPFYPRSPSANLQVPESQSRPRSLPPAAEYRGSSVRDGRRKRSHGRHSGSSEEESDDDDHHRARSPAEKARHFIDHTFSDSPTGLGVGVLGALVGGFAAREAAEAAGKYKGRGRARHHSDADHHRRNQLIGTVFGAAVGALGANAVEKRIELNREKERAARGRKWRTDADDADDDADVVERREVVARPRSTDIGAGGAGGGWKRDWDRASGSRGGGGGHGRRLEREVDTEARSWRNVEDWLYDERNDNKGRPRTSSDTRGADGYRY
ncbi:hypothetical protein F4779DRAFT_576960 [Xylariaceae sp. FL0662B]|nr:hypothetical protein F4779DRAFT_576960 [Xylariaceae sp. FL0662B]